MHLLSTKVVIYKPWLEAEYVPNQHILGFKLSVEATFSTLHTTWCLPICGLRPLFGHQVTQKTNAHLHNFIFVFWNIFFL